MILGVKLKKCYLKYKRQNEIKDYFEELMAWHFATKRATVKLVNP